MRTLALKVLSIVGLVVVTLGGCTNAYGKEILNLELLCEGKAEMTFEDPNAAEKYENMRKIFGDATGFNLLPELDRVVLPGVVIQHSLGVSRVGWLRTHDELRRKFW